MAGRRADAGTPPASAPRAPAAPTPHVASDGRIVRIRSPDGLLLAARIFDAVSDRLPFLCLPGLSRNSRDFIALGNFFATHAERGTQGHRSRLSGAWAFRIRSRLAKLQACRRGAGRARGGRRSWNREGDPHRDVARRNHLHAARRSSSRADRRRCAERHRPGARRQRPGADQDIPDNAEIRGELARGDRAHPVGVGAAVPGAL